ncbi:hypothetical protein [Microbulbifer sp.]|uniref:hypothetical protein n=1 Tax=Microbulbifer sp. TaxID=1908541 RepID=UPI003F2A2491
MKNKIIALMLSILIASCASVRPKEASNYEVDLRAPEETENFVLVNKEVYDDPLLGIILEYENKRYPTDNIDVFVYPVSRTNWDDRDSVIDDELKSVLQEIDRAIEYGYYASREEEETGAWSFSSGERNFKGGKSSFALHSKDNVMLHSNAYVFIAEDKFIKFRTSFDSRATVEWDGDEAVKELLPAIEVPLESVYMKNLRAAHREKMTQDLLRALMQAVKEDSQ